MMRKLGCAGRQLDLEARAGGGAPCVEETLPARSQALATGAIVGAPSVRLQLAIVASLHFGRIASATTRPRPHSHAPRTCVAIAFRGVLLKILRDSGIERRARLLKINPSRLETRHKKFTQPTQANVTFKRERKNRSLPSSRHTDSPLTPSVSACRA